MALNVSCVLNRLAKLCARWLGMCGIHEKKFEVLLTITTANQGFSIGISDVTPGKRLREIKDEEVTEAYKKCDEVIAKFKAGQLETMPGCNEEQTMEVSYKIPLMLQHGF